MSDERGARWDSLVAQTRALLSGGDPARLEATAREMIALDPEHEMGYRLAAEALLRKHDAKGAVRLAREALARAPESDFVHYRLAVFLRFEGDLESARMHAEKAIELQPEHAEYWTELGWITLRDEQDDAARRYADRALALNPADTDALYLRAACVNVDTASGMREALAACAAVLGVDPEHDTAWGRKADLHLWLGELEEAEDAARTALSLDPEDRDHRNVLYGVMRRRSWIYRALLWPGTVVWRALLLFRRIPWWVWVGLLLTGVALPFLLDVLNVAFLSLLCAPLLWLTLVFPVLKAYEWLSTADVRRRAREIAPRRGRLDVHRWPRALRAAIFLLAAAGLWYATGRLLMHERGRETIEEAFWIVVSASVVLVWGSWAVDAVRLRRRKRRRGTR